MLYAKTAYFGIRDGVTPKNRIIYRERLSG